MKVAKNQTWVPASILKAQTGLNNNDLRTYRKYGLVKYTGKHRSILYLLESVPEQFKKQTA